MESPVSPDFSNSFEPAPKKPNTGLIIGIVVAVLLCCCCVIVVGGGAYYYTTQAVSDVYSSINEQLLTPIVPDIEIPAIPESGDPSVPPIPAMPEGVIPEGGLGDDLLRTDTWLYVNLAAITQNCVITDPSATEIEVTQQPDAAGGWAEKWTVACEDGSNKSFDVTFSPSAQGGTDISVSASK